MIRAGERSLYITGHFTIESNILGLTPREMELRLGFRPGRLTPGARVLILLREPTAGEFEPRGSSFFPAAKGLDQSGLKRTVFRPGAWLGQRLVKIEPDLPHTGFEWYPRSSSPVEQWKLIRPVPAYELRRLTIDERYWR